MKKLVPDPPHFKSLLRTHFFIHSDLTLPYAHAGAQNRM